MMDEFSSSVYPIFMSTVLDSLKPDVQVKYSGVMLNAALIFQLVGYEENLIEYMELE